MDWLTVFGVLVLCAISFGLGRISGKDAGIAEEQDRAASKRRAALRGSRKD